MSRQESPADDGSTRVQRFDYNSAGKRMGTSDKPTSADPTKYHAYETDANGSVTGLEDANGHVADNNRYVYDPYGRLVNPDGSDSESNLSDDAKDNPFRYEGFYYDTNVKSYDMEAREYRPDTGRFLSQDRFESSTADFNLESDPLTQSRYAFAGGDPVSNVEFDGHRILAASPGDQERLQKDLEAKGWSPAGGGLTVGPAAQAQAQARSVAVNRRANLYAASLHVAEDQQKLADLAARAGRIAASVTNAVGPALGWPRCNLEAVEHVSCDAYSPKNTEDPIASAVIGGFAGGAVAGVARGVLSASVDFFAAGASSRAATVLAPEAERLTGILSRVPGVGKLLSTATEVREGIYIIRGAEGTYVGQSRNIVERLAQHVRSGRFTQTEVDQAERIGVSGGKTAREIAEQRKIDE